MNTDALQSTKTSVDNIFISDKVVATTRRGYYLKTTDTQTYAAVTNGGGTTAWVQKYTAGREDSVSNLYGYNIVVNNTKITDKFDAWTNTNGKVVKAEYREGRYYYGNKEVNVKSVYYLTSTHFISETNHNWSNGSKKGKTDPYVFMYNSGTANEPVWEVYDGVVYGNNGEVLSTGVDGAGNIYTYWASESNDLYTPVTKMTVSELNTRIEEHAKNIAELAKADFNSISLTRDDGKNVIAFKDLAGDTIDSINVSVTGGTSTSPGNRKVLFSSGSGNFELETGSIVSANEGEEGTSLKNITINGQKYTIAAPSTVEDTNTYVNSISVDRVDGNSNAAKVNFTHNDGTEGYGVTFVGEGAVNVTAGNDGKTITINANDTNNYVTGGIANYDVDGEGGSATLQHKDTVTDLTPTITGLKNTYTKSASYDVDSKTITFTRNGNGNEAGNTYTVELTGVATTAEVNNSRTEVVAVNEKIDNSGDEKTVFTVTEISSDNDSNLKYGINVADMHVSSGVASYDAKGFGSATLTMEDGATAEITELKNYYTIGVGASVNDTNNKQIDTLYTLNSGESYAGISFVAGENVSLGLGNDKKTITINATDYHLVGATEKNEGGKYTYSGEYSVDTEGKLVLNVQNGTNQVVDGDKITITGLATKSDINNIGSNITELQNRTFGVTAKDDNTRIGLYKPDANGGVGTVLSDIAVSSIVDDEGNDVQIQFGDAASGFALTTGSIVRANPDKEDNYTQGEALEKLTVNGRSYSVATAEFVEAAKTVVIAGSEGINNTNEDPVVNLTVEDVTPKDATNKTYAINVANMRVKEGIASYETDSDEGRITLTNQDGTTSLITELKNTYTTEAKVLNGIGDKNAKVSFNRNDGTAKYAFDIVGEGSVTVAAVDGQVKISGSDNDTKVLSGSVVNPDKGKYSIQLQTNEPNGDDGTGNKTIDIENLHDYYTTGLKVVEGEDANNLVLTMNDGTQFKVALSQITSGLGTMSSWKAQVVGETDPITIENDDTLYYEAGDNIVLKSDKDNKIIVATKDKVTFTKVTVESDVIIDNSGFVITNDNNNNLSFTKTEVSVGGNKITNVADGDVSEDSKDAINGSQLNAVKTELTNNDKYLVPNPNAEDGEYTVVKNKVTLKVKNGEDVVINGVASKTELVELAEKVNNVTAEASKKTTVSTPENGNLKVTSTTNTLGGTDYNVDLKNDITLTTKDANNKEIIGQVAIKSSDSTVIVGIDNDKKVSIDGANGTVAVGEKVSIDGTDGDATFGNVSIDGANGTVAVGEKVSIDGTDGDATFGNVSIDGANGSIKAGNVTVNAGNAGTINGLTNKTWNPDQITSGQAATEDQLKAAITTINTNVAAAKTQIRADSNIILGTEYDATDGHTIYTISAVDTKNKDMAGTGWIADSNQIKVQVNQTDGTTESSVSTTIDDVAKASNLGDVSQLNADLKQTNISGAVVHTNVVDAVNKLDDKVNQGWTSKVNGTDVQNIKMGGSQNFVDGTNIKLTTGENNSIKVSTATDVKFEKVTVGDVVVDSNGINAGNKKITNVAAGTEDNDAVNVKQLKETNAHASFNTQHIENLYGQDKLLDSRINQLGSKVNKVGAGAAALAALHPMDFDPDDKLSFAVGAGNYAGETATALGAFYRPNEKVMMNVAGTYGNGENMVNMGVSFALDRTNNVSNSRTAMAKEIVDLREQVATQGQQIAQLIALVNQLAGTPAAKNPAEVLFPDIPENHWAYEYIHSLAARGIVEGYPDGNFGGDRTMTRYEFATMLFKAMQKGVVLSEQIRQEFEKELGRIRVDRVKGADDDANKIERVRVNADVDRDDYGSKVVQVKH